MQTFTFLLVNGLLFISCLLRINSLCTFAENKIGLQVQACTEPMSPDLKDIGLSPRQ